MMNNGKILYNNLTESATVSTSSAAAGFGAEYITNTNPGTVWRSTTISGEWVLFSFENPTNVKGIAVINSNLESGDTLTFEGSNDSDFTTGEILPVNTNTGYLTLDWTYTYYRLNMSKVSGDFIQVGELYLPGAAYEFETNFKWDYSYIREINRNVKQTTSGQVYRRTRFSRCGFNLNFDGISDTQQAIFETISENEYICFLPDGNTLYYGYVDFSEYRHQYRNYWTVSMNFMENPA